MSKKNPAAVALGRIKTAKKTAASRKNITRATRARVARQTPEERSEQARRAVEARWAKKR
jgi:hypothetical protein